MVKLPDAFLQLRVSSAPKIPVFIQKENKFNTRLICGENQEIYVKKLKIQFPNVIFYEDFFMTNLHKFLVSSIRSECAANHKLTEFIMFKHYKIQLKGDLTFSR
jgi:elongation factor P hydroxylase